MPAPSIRKRRPPRPRHYICCNLTQVKLKSIGKFLPDGSVYLLILIFLSLCCCPSPAHSSFSPMEISDQRDPDDAPISLLLEGITQDDRKQNQVSPTTPISKLINSTKVAERIMGDNQTAATISSLLGSAAEQDEEAKEADRLILVSNIIASTIIFLIGFIGNSVVILVIIKFTKVQTVTDIYILNLAVADIMFITGLVFLVTTMMLGSWIFGNIMCKIYMGLTSLNQFASSLLLVVMSFDRFLAVCHPIYAQRFRQLRRAWIICLCIWFICLILMTPILTFAKYDAEKECTIFWPDDNSSYCEMAYAVYSFSIGFAAPLMLIAAFYICVIRKLRSAAKGNTLGASARRARNRESTNRRVEHLVIGIICTYTVCWLPYWIIQLTVTLTETKESSPFADHWWFVLLGTSLSYTNSALNPILYAFLSGNFIRRCNDIVNSIRSCTWLGLRKHNRSGRSSANKGSNNDNAINNSCHQQPAASVANNHETETSLKPELKPQTANQRLNNEQTARLIPSPIDDDNRLRPVELDPDGATNTTACNSSEHLDSQHNFRKKSVAFSADTMQVITSAVNRAAQQREQNEVKISQKSIQHCDITTCHNV